VAASIGLDARSGRACGLPCFLGAWMWKTLHPRVRGRHVPPKARREVGSLSGVAFTKARDGWAVGAVGDRPLILRWNGTQWRQIASPTPPGGGSLNAVAAVSGTSAWAVGSSGGLVRTRTLILRWNGTQWRPVPSPTPHGGGILNGVVAVSATRAWAVGSARGTALIEHWNGR